MLYGVKFIDQKLHSEFETHWKSSLYSEVPGLRLILVNIL